MKEDKYLCFDTFVDNSLIFPFDSGLEAKRLLTFLKPNGNLDPKDFRLVYTKVHRVTWPYPTFWTLIILKTMESFSLSSTCHLMVILTKKDIF